MRRQTLWFEIESQGRADAFVKNFSFLKFNFQKENSNHPFAPPCSPNEISTPYRPKAAGSTPASSDDGSFSTSRSSGFDKSIGSRRRPLVSQERAI